MVGSAVVRRLREEGFENLVVQNRGSLDLTDAGAVRAYFETVQPEYVFLCAAKVGGILANSTYPAEFIQQNLAIQQNVVHESWRVGVKRLLFLGSSCIYPRDCPQPIKEEYLMTGPLEETNRAYSVAKIAGIEMCWAYNRQYGTRYLAAMPTNLYGPGDNYDLQNGHVLPSLIRKFAEAKKKVTLWGSGAPRREFLHSDDLAAATVYLMELPEGEFAPLCAGLVNVGTGEDLTIRELAELIREMSGFAGQVEWDQSKPDGTPRKLLDVSRLFGLGWRPVISLRDGVRATYEEFRSR